MGFIACYTGRISHAKHQSQIKDIVEKYVTKQKNNILFILDELHYDMLISQYANDLVKNKHKEIVRQNIEQLEIPSDKRFQFLNELYTELKFSFFGKVQWREVASFLKLSFEAYNAYYLFYEAQFTPFNFKKLSFETNYDALAQYTYLRVRKIFPNISEYDVYKIILNKDERIIREVLADYLVHYLPHTSGKLSFWGVQALWLSLSLWDTEKKYLDWFGHYALDYYLKYHELPPISYVQALFTFNIHALSEYYYYSYISTDPVFVFNQQYHIYGDKFLLAYYIAKNILLPTVGESISGRFEVILEPFSIFLLRKIAFLFPRFSAVLAKVASKYFLPRFFLYAVPTMSTAFLGGLLIEGALALLFYQYFTQPVINLMQRLNLYYKSSHRKYFSITPRKYVSPKRLHNIKTNKNRVFFNTYSRYKYTEQIDVFTSEGGGCSSFYKEEKEASCSTVITLSAPVPAPEVLVSRTFFYDDCELNSCYDCNEVVGFGSCNPIKFDSIRTTYDLNFVPNKIILIHRDVYLEGKWKPRVKYRSEVYQVNFDKAINYIKKKRTYISSSFSCKCSGDFSFRPNCGSYISIYENVAYIPLIVGQEANIKNTYICSYTNYGRVSSVHVAQSHYYSYYDRILTLSFQFNRTDRTGTLVLYETKTPPPLEAVQTPVSRSLARYGLRNNVSKIKIKTHATIE